MGRDDQFALFEPGRVKARMDTGILLEGTAERFLPCRGNACMLTGFPFCKGKRSEQDGEHDHIVQENGSGQC